MKVLFLLLVVVSTSFGGCSSMSSTSRDAVSGAPIESVKMGFWDAPAAIWWGVVYDRFRFELQAIGEAPPIRWRAIVDCKNIDAGEAFTISVDGVARQFDGHLFSEKMMAYDLTDGDVEAIANAKAVTMRIDHQGKHDDATLQDGQIEAIRKLWQKHSTKKSPAT